MKPVIDVHEHIFRARDIPLEGYLYSRRDVRLAARIGRVIGLPSLLARCVRRRQKGARKGLLCNLSLQAVQMLEGKEYGLWADILSIPDIEEVADLLRGTFKKDGVDLYVPLMIDFEYWFRNTVDTPLVDQIDAVYRDVVLPHKGRIHPFVPFDPARELAFRGKMPSPDGSRERYGSLELVKEAIGNKGFIGVKLYNSLGYRPSGNEQVDDERRKIFRKAGLKQYSVFTGRAIDGVLEKLYRYCEKEEVPITAHCVADGIESRWKASYVFGSPAYWRPVLRRHPSLHLNLAHFGWCDAERYVAGGTGGSKPWVREICEMMRKHPFVFADVAHHQVVVKKRVKDFVHDYRLMLKDFPGVIQEKLLFGIDWHVISRVKGFESFKRDYVTLLKENFRFTPDEIGDFLGGNALRFLGLLGRGQRGKARGPASDWTKNRKRLGAFYKRNGIRPPRWYRDTR